MKIKTYNTEVSSNERRIKQNDKQRNNNSERQTLEINFNRVVTRAQEEINTYIQQEQLIIAEI